MQRIALTLLVLATLVITLTSAGGPVSARSTAAAGAAGGKDGAANGHSKPLPSFVEKKEQERFAAADLVAKGQAAPDANGIVTLKNGKPVRYKLQGTEYLTVALVNFSDVQHDQIAQPDRTVDNSTYWTADTTPQHYADMLFSAGGASYGLPSMRDYYLEISSGRFTWAGQVGNWATIPTTESAFGANSRQSGAGGDDASGVVYRVVDATLRAVAATGNYAGWDLTKADQLDRYDCD